MKPKETQAVPRPFFYSTSYPIQLVRWVGFITKNKNKEMDFVFLPRQVSMSPPSRLLCLRHGDSTIWYGTIV